MRVGAIKSLFTNTWTQNTEKPAKRSLLCDFIAYHACAVGKLEPIAGTGITGWEQGHSPGMWVNVGHVQ